MNVNIYQAGRDIATGRVDRLIGRPKVFADRGDLAVSEQKIGASFEIAGGVKDRAVLDEDGSHFVCRMKMQRGDSESAETDGDYRGITTRLMPSARTPTLKLISKPTSSFINRR